MPDHQPRGYTNATAEDWVEAAAPGKLNPGDQAYFDAVVAKYVAEMAAMDEDDEPYPYDDPRPPRSKSGCAAAALGTIGCWVVILGLAFAFWRLFLAS